jgi:hypothetical protein
MSNKLLTRDNFRNAVFERDHFLCVVCGQPAKDAHHIMERRLWDDGGYYLNNGASLCKIHHLEAEKTVLSCEEIRGFAKINSLIIPAHLYPDSRYDKWGNILLENGMRLVGELFFDESVQKILAQGNVLELFSKYIKYPRTFHLPWSEGVHDDDKVMISLKGLEGQEVIVTLKMDGENTTMYRDYIHARSIQPKSHPSRDWVKNYHSEKKSDIPEGFRCCGENIYARHSIEYNNLESWFQLFSVWNDRNVCLSWDETLEWASLLGIKTVPVIYRGPWNETVIKKLFQPTFNNDPCEGYVVRVSRSFKYQEFRNVVGKFVRKDHVRTHGHWMRSRLEVNKLKQSGDKE